MAERIRLPRWALTTTALLGMLPIAFGGCGEPSPITISGTSTSQSANGQPFTPTNIPDVNHSLSQGQCFNTQPGITYVTGGDLLVNGQQPFDTRGDTGTEYLVTGSSSAQLCAAYGGADIHEVISNPDSIYAMENSVYQGLRRSGCTGGCSSVEFWQVQNGQPQDRRVVTGPSF